MTAPSDTSTRLDRLNAYFDGELAAEERKQVERDLAADHALQDEFRRLQRAWDLLDALPRSDVGANFTRSTVEMIAFDAAEEIATIEATVPRRRWIDRALLTIGAVVAGAAGYLACTALLPHADDALLRDLPVVERMEIYGRAEHDVSVEFLRLVRDRKLLSTTNTDGR